MHLLLGFIYLLPGFMHLFLGFMLRGNARRTDILSPER